MQQIELYTINITNSIPMKRESNMQGTFNIQAALAHTITYKILYNNIKYNWDPDWGCAKKIGMGVWVKQAQILSKNVDIPESE